MKDRKRVQEEEISSYFTSTRPPLIEKSHNVRSRLNPAIRETRDPLQCCEQLYESKTPDSVKTTVELPPVELPYKPYLGFGGSGNRPHNHGSASYLTRSESAYHPSSPPFLRDPTTIEIGQLAGFRAGGAEPQTEICTQFPNLHQSVMEIKSAGTASKSLSGQVGNQQADAEQHVATVETTPNVSNSAQCKYPHDTVNTSHDITTDHAVQTETSSPLKGLLLACDLALAAEPAALRESHTQKKSSYIEPQQKVDRHGELSRRDVGEQVCARQAGERHDAYGTVPRGGRSINSARSCPIHRLAYHSHEADEIPDSVQEDGLRLQQQHAFDRNRSIHSAPRNFSSIDPPVLRLSEQVTSWSETPTTYFSDQDLRSRAASTSRSFSGGTSTAYSTHMFDDYGELQPCIDQQPYLHYAEIEEQMGDAFEKEGESHIDRQAFGGQTSCIKYHVGILLAEPTSVDMHLAFRLPLRTSPAAFAIGKICMLQCQWIKARQNSFTVHPNKCRRHLQAASYRPSATVTSTALALTTQSLPTLPPLLKIKNHSIDRTQQIKRHLSSQSQGEWLLTVMGLPTLLPILQVAALLALSTSSPTIANR